MSCGVDHRCGSDLVLLWLWHAPAAIAPIRPLAWEPPYAVGAALKKPKTNKQKKPENNPLILCFLLLLLLVSCLKRACPRSQRFTSRFSSKNFIVLALGFRSMIYFAFNFILRVQLPFSACGYPDTLVPFVDKTTVTLLKCWHLGQ